MPIDIFCCIPGFFGSEIKSPNPALFPLIHKCVVHSMVGVLAMIILICKEKAMLSITGICYMLNRTSWKRHTAWNYVAVYFRNSFRV